MIRRSKGLELMKKYIINFSTFGSKVFFDRENCGF
jgi:hypothetical protein